MAGVKPKTVGIFMTHLCKVKMLETDNCIPQVIDKVQTRMSKVTGAAEKDGEVDEGASGPCGPGEFPVTEQGSVPNSQTAGPYSLANQFSS